MRRESEFSAAGGFERNGSITKMNFEEAVEEKEPGDLEMEKSTPWESNPACEPD